ncbi:fumarylacetoacetate hydrolase family protein [Novosphingobium sp. B1]|uniref:fumarylacetoacetate hydrolase family protein n=1 Tax=Novosphingobium sp. B1 TaxID=1938756 RepID=UPI0009D8AD8E|nr:fumarylacetoacetate hydrolase family protein [Novosphingobium sp. B1]SMC38463.1 fumarylacetoacetate hydrolase [Novosphingobium sp. B1]
MTTEFALNVTHDPARRSWVAAANLPGTDFPIQNLPFGLFEHEGRVRGGVALGDRVIDLAALHAAGVLEGLAAQAAAAACGATLAPLLDCAPAAVSALRAALSALFCESNAGQRAVLEAVLLPLSEVSLRLPVRPPAFTDFCTSYDHIARMGRKTPGLAALSLPVAYNGRASSVAVSGTPVQRPLGQFETSPGSGEVRFGPEPMLDFELEFGAWLRGGNALGQALTVEEAEQALFGCCLVNDWSARGIQFFESVLGPYLGKSFITTVSPWIVTMEALAPFRIAARGRGEGEPPLAVHLRGERDVAAGAFAIELTADLAGPGLSPQRIVRTNTRDLYWTLAQMVTHQTSNGAPIETGDLIATGTVSGPEDESRACLAEITLGDAAPVVLADGSTRKMLADGDTLFIHGRAVRDGFVPIGFGECAGTILPARSVA